MPNISSAIPKKVFPPKVRGTGAVSVSWAKAFSTAA